MRVLFLPFYGANPHQRQLAEALREIGVGVTLANVEGRLPLLAAYRRAGRPDVVHLHWTDTLLLGRTTRKSAYRSVRFLGEVLAVKALGGRVVWTVHNLHAHDDVHNRIEQIANSVLVRLYDAIIVYGRSAVAPVTAAFRMGRRTRRKIVVSPAGTYVGAYADTMNRQRARAALGLDPRATVFLHFGMIRPYKGVPDVLAAFRALPRHDARLLIAGRPSTDDLARQIREQAAADPRVCLFLKRIPDDDVQRYMHAADAVVLPFRHILNSGSTALAMAFGKAVIAPRFGGVLDLVGERGGLLYEPNDPVGLAQALRTAAQSDDLAERGAHNAARARSAENSWQTVARCTLAAYTRA